MEGKLVEKISLTGFPEDVHYVVSSNQLGKSWSFTLPESTNEAIIMTVLGELQPQFQHLVALAIDNVHM